MRRTIGVTSTYCMHSSADLTEELEAADTDGDGTWDEVEVGTGTGTGSGSGTGWGVGDAGSGDLLADDGLVDNTLTVLVGIAGGIVVGVVGTGVLLAVTGSGLAFLFGLLAWLGSTAYLVRRGTVQEVVSRGASAGSSFCSSSSPSPPASRRSSG